MRSRVSRFARVLSLSFLPAAALAACANDAGARAGAFDGAAALSYARAQLAFGPRVPGTPAWQRGGDWIATMMKQRADSVFEQRWTHTLASGGKLPMRNIIARFRPEATERVLYVAHWDSAPAANMETDSANRMRPIPGANDGASGVGLLVALGDALRKTKPSVGVDMLFVDGEDYGNFDTNTDVLIGSTYFAQNIPWPGYRPMFGVLWDMIGDRDLQIYKEQYSVAQAPEVVDRVWSTAADLGYSNVFLPTAKYPVTDDHIPLLRAGLRVIDVIDLDYPYHHKLSDTADKISAKSLGIVGDVALALVTQQ